jgi:predicted ATP-binding protein involved in virulence
MPDPAANAEAIVLIDELDLHLHPKWQRLIDKNLTAAFPKCQFIATTHSPQVIGEIEHERIQIIANGQVYSPAHSFGVDSSRVLEEIMDARPRTELVQDLLSRLSRAIGDEKYAQAEPLLRELARNVGENDPEVTRLKTLLEFEGEKGRK